MSYSRRTPYIDVLKVFSAWLIMILHVSALYITVDTPLNAVPSMAPYIVSHFSRIALPIFMMMSGALLLRENYTFRLKDKALSLVKVYAIWSAAYSALEVALRYVASGEGYGIKELIKRWLEGPYHFWYLVLLLGFYFVMPILTQIKRNFQLVGYTTLLAFLVSMVYVPLAPHLPAVFPTLMGYFQVVVPTRTLFYFLFGAFLYRLPRERNLFYIATAAFIVGLVGRGYLLFTAVDFNDALAEHLPTAWCEFLCAAGLVYLVAYFSGNTQEHALITKLSKQSLYLYILHPFVVYAYQFLIKDTWDRFVSVPIVSIMVWSVIVFFLTYALRLILITIKGALPFMRKERKN